MYDLLKVFLSLSNKTKNVERLNSGSKEIFIWK